MVFVICAVVFFVLATANGASDNGLEWIVSIEYNESFVCSGVLIDLNWVVTTASCLTSRPYSKYRLYLGTIGDQQVSIKKVMANTDYNSTTSENDIALIMLSRDARTTASTISINTDWATSAIDYTANHQGLACKIVGRGKQYSSGEWKRAKRLRKRQVDVVSSAECDSLAYFNLEVHQCINPFDMSNTCTAGEGGAPTICRDNNRWYLMGLNTITSPYEPCSNATRFTTRISSFSAWIQDVIDYHVTVCEDAILDVIDCSTNPCDPAATCEDISLGHYTCTCPDGYKTENSGVICFSTTSVKMPTTSSAEDENPPFSCPDDNDDYRSHLLSDNTIWTYKVDMTELNFKTAIRTCREDGARLVQVLTEAKFFTIRELTNCEGYDVDAFWIDATNGFAGDYNADDAWTTTDVQTLNATFWCADKPNGAETNHCAQMGTSSNCDYYFDDTKCINSYPFICEK